MNVQSLHLTINQQLVLQIFYRIECCCDFHLASYDLCYCYMLATILLFVLLRVSGTLMLIAEDVHM
jgi:hypothetical protein